MKEVRPVWQLQRQVIELATGRQLLWQSASTVADAICDESKALQLNVGWSVRVEKG